MRATCHNSCPSQGTELPLLVLGGREAWPAVALPSDTAVPPTPLSSLPPGCENRSQGLLPAPPLKRRS